MTARQDSLFGREEVAPVRAAPASPAVRATARTERPAGWRPVTDAKREQACRTCAGAASCGLGEAWYCVACAPADFWPAGSPARARGFFDGSRQTGGQP